MPSRLVLEFLGLSQIYMDDQPVATDRRKAIALLAYLAVNDLARPHQRYSRESLSALLWPDYDQPKAFSNLRGTIWEIHQVLGEGWLIAERESVRLNENARIDLDIARFLDLIAQARQQEDVALRVPPLSDAVKLYRNHFLTGFSLKDAYPFNEWAFAESEELRHKFADALTLLVDSHCVLNQPEAAIPYARRLITLDPLNESAHRQLMEVYLQAGQLSAALKQYQTCEQILRKELGVDPQPETHALYKKIRKREIKPVQVVKPCEVITPKHNLPAQLSTFIGREKEQAEIIHLVTNNRLVTLVGAGGIGKTRLSIQVAFAMLNIFPIGTWLVELAPLSDSALVPQVIVTTLGLIEQTNRSPQTILTDFLQAKRALLILDNCEHLIQACAQLAEALLHACPNLHILATSREALGITGETVHLVPSLTTPNPLHATAETLTDYEAVQLFIERAQATFSNFSISRENAPAIAQICHNLDGIPLALELAAARVKGLNVEQIASRLNDRFRLLTSGSRTALPRHQTLQALIDWSNDLLTEPERVLLRRLSVFAGGWTLEAAESVCAGEELESDRILELLLHLVDKSLVIAETQEAKPRYSMLETIRQYARDKLWEAGEGEVLRQRHLAYFVDFAERAEPNLRAFNMVMWLDWLEVEHDNIRTGLEWAQESDVETQLRLASALLWFWHLRGYKSEGVDWLEQGLSIQAREQGNQPLAPSRALIRGKALNAIGFLLAMYSDFEKARKQLEEGLTLFQRLGSAGKLGKAYALLTLGRLPTEIHGADDHLVEQSLILFHEVKDKFGAAECLMLLASDASGVGNYNQAEILGEEHLALRREIGDQDGIAIALMVLAELAFMQEDYQRAIALYEEGITIFREVGNKWGIGWWLYNLGDVFLQQGDYERATKIYEEALIFSQEVGNPASTARHYFRMGFIAWLQGKYGHATQIIKDSLAKSREVSQFGLFAGALHTLGNIALAQGDEKEAIKWYETELEIAQEEQLELSLVFTPESLGKIAWATGDYNLAAKRFEEGLRMSRETGFKSATFQNLYGLGRVAHSRGDYASAGEYYSEALKMQQWRIGASGAQWVWLKAYRSAVAYPLEAFAVLGAAQNQMERATKLLSAAETLHMPLRFEMSAAERTEHDQALGAARAALGEKEFAKAWAEGQAMTLGEAVAYALKEEG